MMAAAWESLLQGDIAAEALRAAEEIADALVAAVMRGGPMDMVGTEASLGAGAAGQALFFAYAAEALPDGERYREPAVVCLDRAIEAIAERRMSFNLYGGFAGIAWVAEHLRRRAAEALRALEVRAEAAAPKVRTHD